MLLTNGYGPGRPAIHHMLHLSNEERHRKHGQGRFTTDRPLQVGESATVTFKFEIGETEVAVGGRLAIAWRWPFDWSDLQSDDPKGDGYVSVMHRTAGQSPATFSMKYHIYTGVEPWHHYFALQVDQGRLAKGDIVEVTCGDTRQSGAGWFAPTCISVRTGFLMLIDPVGNGEWIRLVDPPETTIAAGPPVRMVAVAPSIVKVGEPFEMLVRLEDQWGNVAAPGDSFPKIRCEETDVVSDHDKSHNVAEHQAAYWYRVRIDQPGTWTLQAAWETSLTAESNPIAACAESPNHRVFWGDFHSGQCEIGCGQGTLREHYQFARDVAAIQFLTHQANDHFVNLDIWNHTRRVTIEFDEPGRYVPLLGCEWSPPTRDGGDRNVAYWHEEPRLRRSGRYFTEDEPDPEPDIPRAPEFLAAMKDQEVLINMHVGGRPTNLDWHEPKIETLAEIHSTHGTSEWFIFDALQRGYRFGITAGTDGVTGRPGADHPGRRLIRNLPGGMTAVLAESLTRKSIWIALKERRCYATTGPRILLHIDVNGHSMGEICNATGEITCEVDVTGTAAIERIDFLRGTEIIDTWRPQQTHDKPHRLRVLWGGTNKRGTARAQTLHWDGTLQIPGCTIRNLERVGFYSPVDDVWRPGDDVVSWRSATAGNHAGFILELDGNPTQALFTSQACSFEFDVAQALAEPLIIDAGEVDRKVQVGRPPDAVGARHVTTTFHDNKPPNGGSPYWIRVTQIDQERAWSTPVYVERTG